MKSIFKLKIMLIFIGIFYIHFIGFSQEPISQTVVSGFSKNNYGGGSQCWKILQGNNNRLYVANNEGLLIYNGTNWHLIPVSNKTIVRSIAFGDGGKLYAGAQDELGFFAPDQVGRLRFTSLKHLLPQQDQIFADVWQLVTSDNEVFFRTDSKIFKFKNGKFTVYPSASAWLSLHECNGRVLAHDQKLGLLIFQDNQWKSYISKDLLPTNFLISDLVSLKNDTNLISTVNNGLFFVYKKQLIPYQFQSNKIKKNQHFTSLVILSDESFLLGTYLNGIYHIAKNGLVLENITTQNGMPNNTVRCLFADTVRNSVWIGLDYGLAFFLYNKSIKHLNPPAFKNGTGYDVKVMNDNVYFALSTGLMRYSTQSISNLDNTLQKPTTILEGLTWNLSVAHNQLFAGRDDGLFLVSHNEALPIAQTTGYWACRSFNQSASNQIVVGNYKGLHFFEIENDKKVFKDLGIIEKFKESSRYIESDKKNIWVSHPYRGIYRISLPEKSIRLFSQKDGLPTDLDNHVFKIKDKIVFATPQGIYYYDDKSGRILKSEEFLGIFGNLPIRYLKEDSTGNIWFVQDKMIGVVNYNSEKVQLHYIPELKNKIVSGFENIFPYDNHNIIIGGEKGFYHLNYKKYLENIKPFSAYVSKVVTLGTIDSVLYGGYTFENDKKERKIAIPYKLNSLHFSFSTSLSEMPTEVEYSYRLVNFDAEWSEWGKIYSKEYTNLPAGTYTFKVKARKSPTFESSLSQFTFTIGAPWYRTLTAYIAYFLLTTGLLFAILKFQSRKYKRKEAAKQLAYHLKVEEEQRQKAYQHQLELAKSERQIIQLQNEKLETEIKYKNEELANATMNLVQKKEFILKLKKELKQFQKGVKAEEGNIELKQILKILAEEEKLDNDLDNFFLHFNTVHGDFLNNIKKQFPSINPHDLRLCAYLRMNLSSKEIAPLLGISVRGVEISRYRLRKKLELPTEANLVEYLLDL